MQKLVISIPDNVPQEMLTDLDLVVNALKKYPGVRKELYTCADGLPGKVIRSTRPLTPDEYDILDWYPPRYDSPLGIELDDGTVLLPSRDAEGNGPGVMYLKQGERVFVLFPKGD